MRTVRILLVFLVLFAGSFFGALIRSRAWGKHFTAIRPGDDHAVVLQRAGSPARTIACAALPEPPDACRTVLVYPGPLSAVMPEFWLIPLDANDRVIRVLHTTRAER